MPPSKIGWHFLPKFVFKIIHSLEEREIACKFFSSARLSKFGQGLRSVRRPYVGLYKPTLDGFCDVHKDSSNYRLLSTFSTVNHVKNAQSCVNRVNAHRGTYGGTYERPALSSPTLCWSF